MSSRASSTEDAASRLAALILSPFPSRSHEWCVPVLIGPAQAREGVLTAALECLRGNGTPHQRIDAEYRQIAAATWRTPRSAADTVWVLHGTPCTVTRPRQRGLNRAEGVSARVMAKLGVGDEVGPAHHWTVMADSLSLSGPHVELAWTLGRLALLQVASVPEQP